jgi:hypothetical protein
MHDININPYRMLKRYNLAGLAVDGRTIYYIPEEYDQQDQTYRLNSGSGEELVVGDRSTKRLSFHEGLYSKVLAT